MKKLTPVLLGLIVMAGCFGSDDDQATSSVSKKAFLTSTKYKGNLGGVSGAHTICSSAASAAGISGTFKALISDSTHSFTTEFSSNATWYWIDGTKAIESKSSLSGYDNSYAVYQDGTKFVSGEASPWTGTTVNGISETPTYYTASRTAHCNNWTDSTSDFKGFINISSVDGNAGSSCSHERPLLCLED